MKMKMPKDISVPACMYGDSYVEEPSALAACCMLSIRNLCHWNQVNEAPPNNIVAIKSKSCTEALLPLKFGFLITFPTRAPARLLMILAQDRRSAASNAALAYASIEAIPVPL
eukprot:scaffold691_cov196-Skeletonema_dohrnii-CCMP3373.AAC.2